MIRMQSFVSRFGKQAQQKDVIDENRLVYLYEQFKKPEILKVLFLSFSTWLLFYDFFGLLFLLLFFKSFHTVSRAIAGDGEDVACAEGVQDEDQSKK
jgi:hypothetical protein